MPPRAKKIAKPAAPKPVQKPVHERGKEYQVEKLTGARAQKGLKDGQPCFTYEVKWKGFPKTTWEPVEMLVNHTAEVGKINEEYKERAKAPPINPSQLAAAAREAAAKAKAEAATHRRELLQRLQARVQNQDVPHTGAGEEFTEQQLADTSLMDELRLLEQQFARAQQQDQRDTAAAAGEQQTEQQTEQQQTLQAAPVHVRAPRSLVFKSGAMCRDTGRCLLPDPADKTKQCLAVPARSTRHRQRHLWPSLALAEPAWGGVGAYPQSWRGENNPTNDPGGLRCQGRLRRQDEAAPERG